MEIRAINHFVAIKPFPAEEMIGAIILPTKNPPQKGVVVSVGPKANHVQEGDIVLISAFNHHTIPINGVEYKITERSNILAILKKNI